eukprot:2554951-Pleurochrysis_carterae.AAC.5
MRHQGAMYAHVLICRCKFACKYARWGGYFTSMAIQNEVKVLRRLRALSSPSGRHDKRMKVIPAWGVRLAGTISIDALI